MLQQHRAAGKGFRFVGSHPDDLPVTLVIIISIPSKPFPKPEANPKSSPKRIPKYNPVPNPKAKC